MRHFAAYALAALGRNSDPSQADVQKILESVAAEINQEQLSQIVKELKGKKLNEVISEGLPRYKLYQLEAIFQPLHHQQKTHQNRKHLNKKPRKKSPKKNQQMMVLRVE